MADQKMMDYIKSNIVDSGPNGVRKALIDAGWDKSQVDNAMKEFQASSGKEPAKTAPSKPASKTGGLNRTILIVAIAVIAVVAVIAAYFLVSGIPENPPVTPPAQNQTPVVAGPISVGVSPATSTAGVGDTVTIGITASGAETLFGFQFNIEYDSSVLSFVSISEGTFLNMNGADDTFCVTPKTDTEGLVKNYACTRTQKGEVSGTGTLATATFTVLSSGTSPITLSNVKFADSKADSITPNSIGGQVVAG